MTISDTEAWHDKETVSVQDVEVETLRLVNLLRVAANASILNRLPEGTSDPCLCPVYRALKPTGVREMHSEFVTFLTHGALVRAQETWRTRTIKWSLTNGLELPQAMTNFIDWFDEGRYPHLQAP